MASQKYNLREKSEPQSYGIGLKELWEVTPEVIYSYLISFLEVISVLSKAETMVETFATFSEKSISRIKPCSLFSDTY